MKELRMLCAEDEQGRTCWMTAFRLFKVTQCLKAVHHAAFVLPHNTNRIYAKASLPRFGIGPFNFLLEALVDQRVSDPPQYGIVLYQNYKIPQQRKTLLSHFSAPVVSLTLSNIYTCAVKCHISLDQQRTDTASPSNRFLPCLSASSGAFQKTPSWRWTSRGG